jgi:CheY-like chemotaxis protein
MEWHGLITPRVLIVEDEESQLRGNKEHLDTILPEKRRELGIDSFACDLAHSVEEAECHMERAAGTPYDLLLLDLGIPKVEGAPESPENGQKLLEKVREEGLAKEIVVISVWFVVDQVARAYRNGAVDFIAKPFTRGALQAQAIECWKRLLGKESAGLLKIGRISDLVPYAEKGLAHRFTTSFSGIVQTVAHNSEDIEQYMHERYGLDRYRDPDDFLFRCLKEQSESIANAQREWMDLLSSLVPQDESPRAATIESILGRVYRSLLPSLIVKHVTLEAGDGGGAEILTFGEDVSAVLKEIIVGILITLRDYDRNTNPISVEIKNGEGQVKVSVIDRLKPISTEDAKAINEGSTIAPTRRFEREWGLSVVQHIAMRGGGRLVVGAQPPGNIVTYFIPSAN